MIEQGQAIPSIPVKMIDKDGVSDTTADAALGTGKVVLFSVPGAFTPTCHVNHLPGFLASADKIKALGVSRIVCAAANDHFVMKAWGEASEAMGKVDFLADSPASLAAALGIEKDLSAAGLGKRYARSAMIIENGVVQSIFVEDGPGVSGSGAPAIVTALESAQ